MILRRPDEELTKCVYMTQKENPTVGDFYSLVQNNWLMVGETLDEASIKASSSDVYKRKGKGLIRTAAFDFLKEKQKSHSKLRDIKYQ